MNIESIVKPARKATLQGGRVHTRHGIRISIIPYSSPRGEFVSLYTQHPQSATQWAAEDLREAAELFTAVADALDG